jgi:hypothetical protein
MKLTRIIRRNLKSAIVVCFLVTTAVCANTQWSWLQANSFGGGGNDSAAAIKIGSDGSQYFTGQFGSSIQFGNTLLTSNGGQDIFLTKLDPSGSVLWAIQAGGPNDDWGLAMALDGADNIYLTGMFYNSATFGSTDGSTIAVSGPGDTSFLAKYNLSGVVAWVQTGTITNGGICDGWGVAVEPTSGTVYLTGRSQGDTVFSSANGTYHVVPGVETWHMFLAKYDTDGNFHWGETNAASFFNSMGLAVAVDKRANAYVAGWLEDRTTFYGKNGKNITITGFSPAHRDSNYPRDAYLVKYDSQGNAKWVNHIGGYVDQANAVAVGPTGEISLVGLVGNINYDLPVEKTATVTSQLPGKNRILGGAHFTNPYNQDVIVATWNSAGVLTRATRIGGPANEAATGIAYDAHGLLYLSGVFQSPFDIGHRHLGGNNQQNLFVLQYSGKTLGRVGTAVNATVLPSWIGTGLSLNSAGDVFVVGTYQDTARFGKITLSGGGLDMFLSELGMN